MASQRDSPVNGGTPGGGTPGGRASSDGGSLQKQRSAAAAARLETGVSELWTVDFRELGIQKQVGGF